MRQFTPNQIEDICIRYQKGETTTRLGTAYNFDPQGIGRLLKRHGLKTRTSGESRRLYTCNHNFFNTITSEAQAYWLGFLAADGNIKAQRNAIVLALAQKDRQHLELFRKTLDATNPIHDYPYPKNKGVISVMQIFSAELCQGLAQYGVVPNKTGLFRWPNLSQNLLKHFLRGYVDGDGSFCFTPTTHLFGLIGNIPFLEDAQHFLISHCKLKQTKIPRISSNLPIGCLRYGGRLQTRRIHSFLYSKASVYLPRKAVLLT